MTIILNGEPMTVSSATVEGVLSELGYDAKAVATAVNGDFVPRGARPNTKLNESDALDVVTPKQGG